MEMSRASYETWVQPAELVRYEGPLLVGVPNTPVTGSNQLTELNSILSGIMECPQVEFIVWHKDYSPAADNQYREPLPLISPP